MDTPHPTPPQHQPSATERQREALKSHIVKLATKAFYAHGVKNVTMDDIAHTLTMSKRTLYQLFQDKEELLLACVISHQTEMRKQLEELYNGEEHPNVLNIMLSTFEMRMAHMKDVEPTFYQDIAKYPKVIAFLEKSARDDESEAMAFIEMGVEQGYFRRDLNFRIIYNQFSSQLAAISKNPILQQFSMSEIFINTVVVYLRGGATIKGVELIDQFLDRVHADRSVGKKHTMLSRCMQ